MRFSSLLSIIGLASLSSQSLAAPTYYGGAYVIDNAANNNVISFRLASDGTPTYANTYPTGGKGTAGGGDSLFSADSVAVSGSSLLVVNAGSSSVSLFSINNADPGMLTMIGNPVSSNGDYPVSVAFNPSGNIACVLNGGINNGFRCFSVSSTNGLTPMPTWDRSTGLNITTNPPKGPPNTLSDISFSSDGLMLFVSAKIPNGLFSYTINGNTLSTMPTIVTPKSSILPFSITKVGTNTLFLTDPGLGGGYTFTYNTMTGTTNAALSTNVFMANTTMFPAICWAAYSKQTNNIYAISAGGGSVVELSWTASSLSLVNFYSTGTKPLLDSTIANINGNDVLFVISAGTAPQLNGFKLSGGSGKAVPLTPAPLPTTSALASAQGVGVYVSTTSSGTASQTKLHSTALLAVFAFIVAALTMRC